MFIIFITFSKILLDCSTSILTLENFTPFLQLSHSHFPLLISLSLISWRLIKTWLLSLNSFNFIFFSSFSRYLNLTPVNPVSHHCPVSTVPSFVCLCCGVWKKLQTPCAQITKVSRGESRAWTCLPEVSPVVVLFALFLVPSLSAQLFPSWVQGPAHNLLWTLSVTSDQAIIPGLLTTLPRKYYLIHEWTCLFIECHHDAWYLLL